MNKQEYLLACLAEECAELQKAAMKALRFGLDNGNPFNKEFISNRDEIKKEFNDVVVIAEMLNKEAGMTIRMDDDAQDIKKKKVQQYMEVSKQCGTLKEGDN